MQLEQEDRKKKRVERFGAPDISSMSSEVSVVLWFFIAWNCLTAQPLPLLFLTLSYDRQEQKKRRAERFATSNTWKGRFLVTSS